MKIKIGIIFGGISKEREISFAGGRTVYDNLDKSKFEAVPLFADSFGNLVLLDWQFIYKGSIRDFYPPVDFIPSSKGGFQVYAESIGELSPSDQEKLINKIGRKVQVEELRLLMDFAFLCLHGPLGEDGTIQGMLEYLAIPYSGSGILPSAIGIDKAVQKKLMSDAGFPVPEYFIMEKEEWLGKNRRGFYKKVKENLGFPVVIKAASQGSSIGISILTEDNEALFEDAVSKAFFLKEVSGNDWNGLSVEEKISYVRNMTDIREGIGIPLKIGEVLIHHPDDLIDYLNNNLSSGEYFLLESLDGENKILAEKFIEGKEYSCIVVQDEITGKPLALPPTEIRKGKELFDYRSKYLPGLSRKITPIDLPSEHINKIRSECEKLFSVFGFDVYARIDGFITADGKIFLNDPNTTSGMMPSSFFFHQAAEIGLNPSQFLTYIIRTSLKQRSKKGLYGNKYLVLLRKIDNMINEGSGSGNKKRVAVLLGGYSSERHISVESGRNVYEKLSSSIKYEPVPVFVTGNENNHLLYRIPVNLLLKDNADDIRDKMDNFSVHPVVSHIIKEAASITEKYSSPENLASPKLLTYEDLAENFDAVFIALHGRPGEDGAVQSHLDRLALPYNGSEVESSRITINKYETNEILRNNGFLVAEHLLVGKQEWRESKEGAINKILSKIEFPFIAKPVDDGCSSAVKKIKNKEELIAFAELIFRDTEEFLTEHAKVLNIKPKEEFPMKDTILFEELISKKGAKHFLEITGGMLSKINEKGELVFEIFEASEALSEGEVLSLEEKFLAGQGQNITPARYAHEPLERQIISDYVKNQLEAAAKVLNVSGYCRIDAFVRIYDVNKVEVIFIEVNSLPGMTPATCIFHQAAINGYKPYDFIDNILEFSFKKRQFLDKAAV
jgi:UDP-N-acetylmuramate--alanine ligase